MSKADPDNGLRSAGYLLIRTPSVPEGIRERELLTSKVSSVCECIYARFPGTYAMEWCAHSEEERGEEFDAMGVAEDLRDDAIEWATDSFEQQHGAWGVFYKLEDARAAWQKFLKNSRNVRLIGLGVRKGDAAAYVKANQPPKASHNEAPEGLMGNVKALMAHEPMAPGGKMLGYELLVTDHRVLGCSWLCDGLEEELAEKLNIKPNEFGLIADYDDAQRGAEYINSGIGAEPGVWMPWALVEYRVK